MEEKEDNKGITVKKLEDMPEWYSQSVLKSELADYSPVKGCMIIRPYGYAIWQNIQDYFNERIKKLGVKNAYFPLFIPESFFKKEADHAEGFSPEVAWVENRDEKSERIAVRPTSETIMYDSYAKWVRSYRDLPLRINQWCNVVRWEVSDVKLFLRSREFLWQEGHCVYQTEEECDKETMMYLDEYDKLCKDLLALPMLKGRKTEKEKFAGAKYTTTIEAFMPDGKALQCGTSHNLGQSFAKAFDIKFKGKDENLHYPWQNSWGFSTRLIGGMIMQHGDDKGVIIPPRVAPLQAVIVPILFEKSKEETINKAEGLKKKLENDFRVEIDARDEYSAGYKFNEWELKGVPVRIEIGPKDIEKEQVVLVRRDNKKKEFVKQQNLADALQKTLDDVHDSLYNKAKGFLDDSIVEVDGWQGFNKAIQQKKLVRAPFCGTVECEEAIKDETNGASSRCIIEGCNDSRCIRCGKEAREIVIFGKSY